LQGFNWRGDERLEKKQDLFKGKVPPELVKIQGIPLPEPIDDFFDEREDGDMLLNENSRLQPQDLKDKTQDSIPSVQSTIPQGVQVNPVSTSPSEGTIRASQIKSETKKDSLESPNASPKIE